MKEYFEIDGAAGKPIYGDITVTSGSTTSANIVFIHGFKGFKDWGAYNLLADYFAERGYRFIKFNLSHSGANREIPGDVTDMGTFAENTFSKEQEDITAVLNYTTTHFAEPIILIGHSRGGGLAILQAAKDKRITKLISLAAVNDFKNLWKQKSVEDWKRDGRIYIENARTGQQMPLNLTLLEDYNAHQEALNINAAASKITIPWLIVHGDTDQNVPFEVAKELKALHPAAMLAEIKNTDHVFGASHPYQQTELPEKLEEVCNTIASFLKK